MHIQSVRISGFKAFPFCASLKPSSNNKDPVEINWNAEDFLLSLPVQSPKLSALIGPNCCGKSTIFEALDLVFGSTKKLAEDQFHGRDSSRPVIIEVSLLGSIQQPGDWHNQKCTKSGDVYRLTLAYAWEGTSRTTYVYHSDRKYHRATTNDQKEIDKLLPNFILIPSQQKLGDEANPEKRNLLADLILGLLDNSSNRTNRSIIFKLQRATEQVIELIDRDNPPNAKAWKEIEELEQTLSDCLSSITPDNPQIRLKLDNGVPSVQEIFLKSRIAIQDGIELDFEKHGLGLQRSFVVSTLRAWSRNTRARQDDKDYIFAIEEPEIYLHPHTIRVLLHTLQQISQQDQVLFTSHSNEFVNCVPFDNIISIRRSVGQRYVVRPELSNLAGDMKLKVQRYLREERSDMLFARVVLLVEGQSEYFAIPEMARKLDCDLDREGISIVFVNGNKNFEAYHYILKSFGIPHVILGDGDGNQKAREEEYQQLANEVVVLEEDFEYLVANKLVPERLLTIINECRSRRGANSISSLCLTDITAESIKSHWWQSLKEDIHSDIPAEHRSNYEQSKGEIHNLLLQLAQDIVNNNHLLPTTLNKRKASMLKREGKPLVGRVVGELLCRQEINEMLPIVETIQKCILLAQSTTSM